MPRINHAIALRCIGQDLESRGLKTFEICRHGTDYHVRAGYQEPPAPMPVTIRYSLPDIEELERGGEEKRGGGAVESDFLSSTQVLRTIGGYLDKNEGRLIRISNNDSVGKDSLFKVEYVTRDGERVIDERAGATIYDLCVAMYRQRGKMRRRGFFSGRHG
jgi:hypothetical protein